MRDADAAEPATPPRPAIEQLVAGCQSAKADFAPPTEATLKDARAALTGAIARLDRKLKVSGPGAQGWKRFLKWDAMQRELTREAGPDLTVLDEVYAKYASGHNGLDLAAFVDVREALHRYLITARAIGNDTLAGQYEALLDALAERLTAFESQPTAENAAAIGDAVRWLEEAGQAAELVEAIRAHFSQPNLFLRASAAFISAGLAGPVDSTGPVRDVILGTRVSGTEHTTGEITVELIPKEEYAEIDLIFRGTTQSETIGVNGPARVASEGTTRVAARKAIRIDADRVWTLPTRSNAITKTTIKSVQTTRGGGMVAQTARQQVYAQKPQSERVAARHAEQRVNRRMDEQAGEQVGQLAENYQEKFRKPLLDRYLFPKLLRFHTTEEALHATVLHGGQTGLGASSAPPAVDGDYDVVAVLDESMVNNFAAGALSGMILEEDALRSRITELLGSTPTWLEPDEESEPWTISFAQRHPVSFVFTDGGFSVTLRGREYVRGDKGYPGMNVSATYTIEGAGDGFKAVRKGELEIVPPGRSRQLSASEQVLRTLLEKRFGKIFQEEIAPEPIVLSGTWEKAGQLVPAKWEVAGGWMVLAWNRAPAPPKEASETPADSSAP